MKEPFFKILKKPLIMKRFLIILAFAGALTACNNSADTTGEKKDSIDSLAGERKDMVDSSADQQKNMIDSAADKKKDELDRVDSIQNKDLKKKD